MRRRCDGAEPRRGGDAIVRCRGAVAASSLRCRWPATHAVTVAASQVRAVEWVTAIALVLFVVSCTPRPPTVPEEPAAPVLYLPLAMVAPYHWQATGYGRPYGAIGKDAELHGKGMWSYTWGVGNCTRDVPMVYSDGQMPAPDVLARCAAVTDVLLAFNEPEYTSQANMTPEAAAKTLRHLESVWPGELWCCGNLVANHAWFDQMMAAYKAAYDATPRIAGVHVHIYVGGGLPDVANPDDGKWLKRSQGNYKAYLGVMRKRGMPERVVVSECCLLGKYSEGTYLKVQEQYMTWLRSEPAVESVAWFSARYAGFPDANLLRAGGGLTVVGESWLGWRWR